jgi:hypothetical protein
VGGTVLGDYPRAELRRRRRVPDNEKDGETVALWGHLQRPLARHLEYRQYREQTSNDYIFPTRLVDTVLCHSTVLT